MPRERGHKMSGPEREIARERAYRMHINGMSAPMIAMQLGINVDTVRRYWRESRDLLHEAKVEQVEADTDDFIASQKAIKSEAADMIGRIKRAMDAELAREEIENENLIAQGRAPRPSKVLSLLRDGGRAISALLETQGNADERMAKVLGLIKKDGVERGDVQEAMRRLDEILLTPIEVNVREAPLALPEYTSDIIDQ